MQRLQAATSRGTLGACDACKRRKVKCDATVPCANCTISQIPCEHRTLPRKRGRPARTQARTPSLQDEICEQQDTPLGGSSGYPEPQLPDFRATTSPDGSWPAPGVCRVTTASISTNPSSAQAWSPLFRDASGNDFVLDSSQVFQTLILAVNEHLTEPGETVATYVGKCVDLFMQYQFPNGPITHEPTLRSAAALFDLGSSPENDESSPIETLRALTLVTALCAYVSSTVPDALLPGSKGVLWPFYHASRAMLRLYEEVDLESPHSSSYYIRSWQSAALQNITGRDRASWHIHGEGTLLAMRAQIYDEATVSLLPRLEAQLLRVNFWFMYLADKTAAAFECRPYVISDDYLAGKLTLREQGEHEDLLLDSSRSCNQNLLEHRVMVGFHLKRRLWAAAADMVREIRLFATRRQDHPMDTQAAESGLSKLIEMYSSFVALVDHLPSWLQSPQGAVETVETEVAEYQIASFWAQRSNIMSVYNCMRLLILQKCIESSIPEVVGLNDRPVSWAMQKLEIARDFLRELQIAPFVCFKVQGESAVSSPEIPSPSPPTKPRLTGDLSSE
ncbi:hypothetical protein ACJ41O_003525 [Fusarium nematophilum]